MSEPYRSLLAKENWPQLASVAVVIFIAALGGAAWIINTVNSGNTASLAAINAQAQIVGKSEADLDHRVTTLEAQFLAETRAVDRLTNEIEQLRGTEGDLTTAVQRLNDLLPEQRDRRH